MSDSSLKAGTCIIGHPEINSQHLLQCLAECRYAKDMLVEVMFRKITLSLHIVKMIEKFRGKYWITSN